MGGFPESLRWHADHFVCAVLALRQGFCYVPKAGAAFRKLAMSDSAQGMGGEGEQEVMLGYLDCLCRPEFTDIKSALRDSQVLAIFDRGLLGALWRNRAVPLLPDSLVAGQALLAPGQHGAIRHPVPAPVKQWVRRRFLRPHRL